MSRTMSGFYRSTSSPDTSSDVLPRRVARIPSTAGKSKHGDVRYYDIHEGELDEALFAAIG